MNSGGTRTEGVPGHAGGRSRLRSPAVMAVGGTVIAGASALGSGWPAGVAVEVVTVAACAAYWVVGGRDTDVGAIIGSRPDERQTSVAMRASALAASVMAGVALVGFAVAVALHAAAWPFELVADTGAAAFVAGLFLYRYGGRS